MGQTEGRNETRVCAASHGHWGGGRAHWPGSVGRQSLTLTFLPEPETTLPAVGFFWAAEGSRIPPWVASSFSATLTRTRSPTGETVLN